MCVLQDTTSQERTGRKGQVRRALKFAAGGGDSSKSASMSVSKSRGKSVGKSPAPSKSPAPKGTAAKATPKKAAKRASKAAEKTPKGGKKSTTAVSKDTVEHRLETNLTAHIYDEIVEPALTPRRGGGRRSRAA